MAYFGQTTNKAKLKSKLKNKIRNKTCKQEIKNSKLPSLAETYIVEHTVTIPQVLF